MQKPPCQVVRNGNVIELRSPAFVFRLDVADGLRAVSWENRITGRTLAMHRGQELECDLDTAARRIWILGWHGMESAEGRFTPNADPGYRAGFHYAEFNDAKWPSHLNPAFFWQTVCPRHYWARTHVFLPADCRAQPLSLVLGNLGLFDFRFMRVFVNGRVLGTRRVSGRWHEPGVFDFGPQSKGRRFLRFGQDNVIALQLAAPIRRTAWLNELDPKAARSLPFLDHYAPPFEQYLTVGTPLTTPYWRVTQQKGRAAEAVFDLKSSGLAARVIYRWNANEPTLHKFVQITNQSGRDVRLMNVRLGSYRTGAGVSDGEQGFPVYLDDERFVGLAHPAGWAMGENGRVELRQYPGKALAPGERFDCMEIVLGVAAKGGARRAFHDHVRSRMRRVRREHNQPYAIFEPFGSWPIPQDAFLGDKESEALLLDNLRKVGRAQREQGCGFDYYSLEFWADQRGDLERPHADLFPNGFSVLKRELRKHKMKMGLWLDNWCICDNPVMSPSRAGDPAYHSNPDPGRLLHFICLASEPARTIHETALRHHLRTNGVRLLKFDSLRAICYNPAHGHLPGLYSIEAIHESVIGLLRAMDVECADAFLMLYWGYRSPWWLLYADTMFEPGLAMEAATPSPAPTLFARDGVTQGLDQAQWFCNDVPPLGKDSLGVWLSDWPWNSCLGKEHWQKGFVMDLCRGHLLAQPWSDYAWLSPAERRQMAQFLALLRARPECFGNPRFILGNPWKNEPYGYCCTDGRRAFLALYNCVWRDAAIPLQLNSAWGLPDGCTWEIYRWFPNPARLTGDNATMALRPFEIVLLEVAPQGETPTLQRKFTSKKIPSNFVEHTVELKLAVARDPGRKPMPLAQAPDQSKKDRPPQEWAKSATTGTPRVFALAGQAPSSSRGGILVITAERSKNGLAFQGQHPDHEMGIEGTIGKRVARPIPALKGTIYPTAWQTWRIPVPPSACSQPFQFFLTVFVPSEGRVECKGYFIPR
ncbi:MAG: hypothetical protein HY360_11425 [Verrucomicrobia bacterium]|nr:hypothetical protein [Verrucomicrobiota bacterium]